MTATSTAPATTEAAAPDTVAVLAALGSADRPEPQGPLAASATFGWRTLLRITYVPEQLFDVTVFPAMVTLIFAYLLGGALAGSVDRYLQFSLPGILVQSILMITLYATYTSTPPRCPADCRPSST
jgi:ABC-2 type transport system permease protein